MKTTGDLLIELLGGKKMKENLVKITMNRTKGWIDPTVSETIRELTYDEMAALRQAFCTVIAEAEDLWQQGQSGI